MTTGEDHGHELEGEFPFYSKPVQRQRWGDEQIRPHTNWGDTFFDLFYVSAAYNLGNLIRLEPTSRGILYFIGIFWPIMFLWSQKMAFDSRFFTRDDMWHRVYELAVLVVLATAVLHIRPASILSDGENNIDMFAYCISITIGNFLSIGRMVEILISVEGEPAAKVVARRDIVLLLGSTSLFLAATVVAGVKYYERHDAISSYTTDGIYPEYGGNDTANHTSTDDHDRFLAAAAEAPYEPVDYFDTPIWLVVIGCLMNNLTLLGIMFCLPSGGRHKEVSVPMNISFVIQRYGEWTMLMLGESVLSLLIVEVTEGSSYYKTFFSGIISITLLEYLHFRSQPHSPDDHAMRRKKEAGILFVFLMQVYSAALIVLGTAYKMLLYEYVYEAGDSGKRMLFPVLSRLLAGSSGADDRFTPEDRRQKVAHFFCASMAIIWFCSDVMTLAHRGLKDNLGRCRISESGALKYASVTFFVVRVGLIVFIATLSQYVTQPDVLALIGLLGILCQVALRFVGSFVFEEDFTHEGDFDELWPNVTQPQAIEEKAIEEEPEK